MNNSHSAFKQVETIKYSNNENKKKTQQQVIICIQDHGAI